MARTEQLMWIPVLLDDVESDLSRYHRIDDYRQLSGSRFLQLVERLPVYDGAVAHSFRQATRTTPPPPAGQQGMTGSAPGVQQIDDVRQLEQLTASGEQSGMPGIEYSGG